MRPGSLVLLTAAALSAGGGLLGAPPAPARSERQWLEFCGVLRRCGLRAPDGTCSEALSRGVPGVAYDARRCQEPRALFARGLTPAGPLGFRLYRFLGRRYRVEYLLEGELAMSADRLSFLLEDLPLAARLLTHFQKVAYTAEYVDRERRRFKASRAGKLSGEGEVISGGPAEGRLFYFGHGTSELGPWKLRGLGLVEVEYAPATPPRRALAYRVKVVATPANAFYNVVMNRGLFKAILRRKIREVLSDIAEASRKLDRAGAAGIAGSPQWSPEEKEKVAALLRRP